MYANWVQGIQVVGGIWPSLEPVKCRAVSTWVTRQLLRCIVRRLKHSVSRPCFYAVLLWQHRVWVLPLCLDLGCFSLCASALRALLLGW